MKRSLYILVCFFVFIISSCSAQKKSVLKLYAYAQQVLPGNIPKEIDESGNVIRREFKPAMNYFFYAENQKKDPIYIDELWIDSVQYSVTSAKIESTPVIFEHFGDQPRSDSIQLVPSTGNDVFHVVPDQKTTPGKIKNKELKKLLKSRQVIIGFMFKGRKYYTSVEKMKDLPSNITQ